jgi:cell pole-organizing protein PopZ
MNRDVQNDQDVIRYIQNVMTKHRDQHSAKQEPVVTTDKPESTPRQTTNIANAVPDSTQNLASAIDISIQSAVSQWFKTRPSVIDSTVHNHINTLVEKVIQQEVRKWINEYLPHHVRSAVQELIDTIKRP